MNWKPYSDNLVKASNEFKETKDCTVKAWANVFDCEYKNAHAWLKKYGRRDRHGMLRDNTRNALNSCKKAKVKEGPYSRSKRITVSQFIKDHPTGRYYVASLGHAFCIKDGVVHDWKFGPRREITFAYRVYLEGEY